MTIDESAVVLGEKYRDTISGFEGTAVARVEYLHGCTRIDLEGLVDGKPEGFTFDAPRLVRATDEAEVTSLRTGGVRPAPPRTGLR